MRSIDRRVRRRVAAALRGAQDRIREFKPVGDDEPDPDHEIPVVPASRAKAQINEAAR